MKRAAFLASLTSLTLAGALLIAQQNAAVPQPRADALPPPGPGSPKVSRIVPKPEGILPTVPAGFTVSVYAELQAPRMMAYAPNGDLFVSSPTANNITVLRDANNDGVFEAREVYAAGPPPPARGGGRGAGAPAGPPPGAGAPPAGAARTGGAPPPAAGAAPAARPPAGAG